jgi:hypothetical protein
VVVVEVGMLHGRGQDLHLAPALERGQVPDVVEQLAARQVLEPARGDAISMCPLKHGPPTAVSGPTRCHDFTVRAFPGSLTDTGPSRRVTEV